MWIWIYFSCFGVGCGGGDRDRGLTIRTWLKAHGIYEKFTLLTDDFAKQIASYTHTSMFSFKKLYHGSIISG